MGQNGTNCQTLQLDQFWTVLGGNRRILAELAAHQELLQSISDARANALITVTKALHQLEQLSADLESFRKGMVIPENAAIPLEVHLESIKLGVTRLADFRKRVGDRYDPLILSSPLDLHLNECYHRENETLRQMFTVTAPKALNQVSYQ